MKIAINACYGGFNLSTEALLWLYEKSYRDNLESVEDYYEGSFRGPKECLKKWRQYLQDKKEISFLTVFSPDEKHVVCQPVDRAHSLLIECIEALGDKANGSCSRIKIVEIPDDIEYEIEEFDGLEHVAEKHQIWD